MQKQYNLFTGVGVLLKVLVDGIEKKTPLYFIPWRLGICGHNYKDVKQERIQFLSQFSDPISLRVFVFINSERKSNNNAEKYCHTNILSVLL